MISGFWGDFLNLGVVVRDIVDVVELISQGLLSAPSSTEQRYSVDMESDEIHEFIDAQDIS